MIPQQHKQNIELVYSEGGREFFKQAQEKLPQEKVNNLKAVWVSRSPEVAIRKFEDLLKQKRN